jgi:hypothetical protein
MPLPHIMAAVQRLQRQVYLLLMPPQKHLAQLRSVPALASLFVAAVRTRVAAGQTLVLSGIGAGGVVAHEMTVQLQRAGEQVRSVSRPAGITRSIKLLACVQIKSLPIALFVLAVAGDMHSQSAAGTVMLMFPCSTPVINRLCCCPCCCAVTISAGACPAAAGERPHA